MDNKVEEDQSKREVEEELYIAVVNSVRLKIDKKIYTPHPNSMYGTSERFAGKPGKLNV